MTSSVPSKENQIKEILKCGKDSVYFMKKYIKIQHPKRGLLLFETYPFQDDCVKAFDDHRFNIVCKSRQLGLSTVTAAYAVWYAIFRKDKNILVIATKLKTAMNFIKKVKVMLDNVPRWLLLTKYEPTKQQVTFDNGSSITAIPTSPDAGRSEALSLLVVDEAAFIKDFSDIWTGLSPTISTGGSTIIISTPNGVGNTYHRLWTDAIAQTNEFNAIKLPWWVHPEHDQAWFDKETRSLTKQQIAQEFLCVNGDAKIITPDGYQLASNIHVGDLVLTHKGRFRRVLSVNERHVRDDENIYSVTSPGNRKNRFLVTGNHPTLSYRFWLNNKSSLDHVAKHPEIAQSWIDFDTLVAKRKNTDRVVSVLFPCYDKKLVRQQIDRIDLSTLHDSIGVTDATCRYYKQWGHTNRYVNVDFDLGKFVGLYLAEGCNSRGGFDFGFHSDEYDTLARWVVNYAQSIGCRVTLARSKIHNSCRLWSFNKHVGALLRSFVSGNSAHEKTLNFDRVVQMGEEFIRGLLYGHYLGDGNHSHDRKFCIYSTSSKLTYQLRTLNSIFGLYPRIGVDYRSHKNKYHNDMWYLEFQANGVTYFDLLTHGQQIKKQSRVRLVNGAFIGNHTIENVTSSIKNIDGGLIVYDIKVEDDRSFVVESAVLHNCDFISSGTTFLQVDEMEYLRSMITAPIRREGLAAGVWIWSDPLPGKKYVISADVSRGDSHDYSTFHVISADDCEVVAEFMGKTPPDKLADMMLHYGKIYNEALLCQERNSFGYFTGVKLRDSGYKRLWYKNTYGDPFTFNQTDPEAIPGFETQSNSRAQILGCLEQLVRNKVLTSYSQRLYDQLQEFVWIGSKAQASRDSHDDLIISLSIGLWISGDNASKNFSSKERDMTLAMLKATSVVKKELPIVASSDGLTINRHVNPYKTPPRRSDVHRDNVTDFSWLMR